METLEAVKERPILFSPEMAKALDLGQKRMTRRLVRPQPQDIDQPWPDDDSHVTFSDILDAQPYHLEQVGMTPFGKVGDILWVRENYRVIGWEPDFSRGLIEYQGGTRPIWKALPKTNDGNNLQVSGLKAYVNKRLKLLGPIKDEDRGYYLLPKEGKQGAWRSSLYMPRWASRNTVKIESISTEELQEISFDDAILEGAYTEIHRRSGVPYREVFSDLWNSLHDEPFQWLNNPWVFVLGFSKV